MMANTIDVFESLKLLTFKCTKKVQDYLSLLPEEISPAELNSESLLGDWYVNLLVIDRRKCLLFVNERTLMSFIAFGIKKSNRLKDQIHELFIHHLFQLGKLVDLPLEGLGQVLDEYFESRYSKTSSKRLLGHMNELAYLYQDIIMDEGGFTYCDLNRIIFDMNHMPQSNIGFKDSVELAKELMMVVKVN